MATPAPEDIAVGEAALVSLAVATVALAVLGGLFVFAILQVSKRQPTALLATLIALLTLVALGIFGFTGNEIAGTLAASGMGGLTASLAALFRRPGDDSPPPETPAEDAPAEP